MNEPFVAWFRQASPYIHAHRGQTLVVCCSGAQLQADGCHSLVHDLALLASLGLRLVVVHGARPQIDVRLAEVGMQTEYVNGVRVTEAAMMPHVIEAAATVRVQLEASFSQGLPNSPMGNARLRVAGGNFVVARPRGIENGVDFGYTGEVRRVDAAGIRERLAAGDIVLVSTLGYSATGEVFNVELGAVAVAVSTAIGARKLVLFTEEDPTINPLSGEGGRRELTRSDLDEHIAALEHAGVAPFPELLTAAQACSHGTERAHLVPARVDGGILLELFSRDGCGLMVSRSAFDTMRRATMNDVGGIIELIRPLEEDGILVRRSRAMLEQEVERFFVAVRDESVIGCAALYPVSADFGEVACLVVDPDYARTGFGSDLLELLEREARRLTLTRLVVLTTQADHWFQERGFIPGSPDHLPEEKRRLYNWQRNSKVLLKTLA